MPIGCAQNCPGSETNVSICGGKKGSKNGVLEFAELKLKTGRDGCHGAQTFPISCVTKPLRVTLSPLVRRTRPVALQRGCVCVSDGDVATSYYYCCKTQRHTAHPSQPRLSPLYSAPPTVTFMANAAPQHIPIPAILNPLINYISSCLPPPVYNALLTLFAHGLAFFGALIGLGSALISSKPSDWDAQKILPPLITLLAAYLALASAVRTATWLVRTTAWLVKWGVIAGAVSAAAAWLFGGGGGGGIVPSVTGMVLDMLYGQGQDATGGSRSDRQRARPRPQAWDSFDEHWEWQFEEQQWNAANPVSPAAQVQRFVANALDHAREGNWMSIARSAQQSFYSQEQTGEDGGDSHEGRHDQTERTR
jgi:hypothetical protein